MLCGEWVLATASSKGTSLSSTLKKKSWNKNDKNFQFQQISVRIHSLEGKLPGWGEGPRVVGGRGKALDMSDLPRLALQKKGHVIIIYAICDLT